MVSTRLCEIACHDSGTAMNAAINNGPEKAERAPADFVSTDHLRRTLKTRTIKGGVISIAAQTCQLVFTLTYNIVMARLLSPVDFGLFAMVMTAVGFLRVFKDAGLATVTVQREDITREQVSNLFWVNLCVSSAIGLSMAAASPAIAAFFRQPELVSLSIALSFGFILDGLGVQHVALLNRMMRFKIVSILEVGSLLAGFIVGIALAMNGAGYWSLAIASLVTAVLRLFVAWTAMPWRPSRFTRQSGTRSLITFGADLTVAGLVFAIARGCDSLLIGRFLGSEAVGLYSRGSTLFMRPMEQLTAPIYSAVGPALSRIQVDGDRYRRTFLQLFECLVLAGFLFVAVFLPLAYPFVTVVLSEKWVSAVPIFSALTLSAVFYPPCTATSWLYVTQGRGREFVRVTVITAIVAIASYLCGLPFGTAGVALAYSLTGIFLVLPMSFFIAGRSGPVATRDLWRGFFKHVPAAALTLLVTTAAAVLTSNETAWLRLWIGLVVAAIACTGSVFLFSGTRNAILRVFTVLKELRLAAAAPKD